MRTGLAAALLLGLAAAPATASTIPPLDLTAGQTAVGFGYAPSGQDFALDFSFDRSLAEHLAAGATLHHVNSPYRVPKTMVAGRLAWMPGEYTGLVASLGGGHSPWGDDVLEGFVQVGGAVRWGLGPLTLRLTLGPAVILMARMAPRTGGISYFDPTPPEGSARISIIPLIPNAELGLRVWNGHELVLGGYTIVGWRGRF